MALQSLQISRKLREMHNHLPQHLWNQAPHLSQHGDLEEIKMKMKMKVKKKEE